MRLHCTKPWRFATAFGLIAAVLLATYYFPYAAGSAMRKVLDAYLRLHATVAGALLAPLEPSILVNGQSIYGRYTIRIVKTCDGMDVYSLYLAAVLAWPSAARRRLLYVFVGLGVLLLTNTIRILSLYYVGVYAPSWFEFAHMELWPAFILVLAAGLFGIFVRGSLARVEH